MYIKLLNVGTGTYLDLDCARPDNGTLVHGWIGNDFGTWQGELWELDCQDHVLQHYTIMNAKTKTYATTTRVHEGAGVVGNKCEQVFELLDVKEGIVKIKVIKSPLVFALRGGTEQVVLQPIKRGDPKQEWIIVRCYDTCLSPSHDDTTK